MDKVELIKKAYIVAINSFQLFVNKLGINPKAFEHLYKINFKIGNTNDDATAEFAPNSFSMTINSSYVNDLLNEVNNAEDKNRIEIVIYNFALTIVHEMIHANRCIMINNGLNIENLEDKLDNELLNYELLQKGYDKKEFDKLLEKVLELKDIEEFGKYIPIKYSKKGNEEIVIAFNKETNCYEEFKNSFGVKLTNPLEIITNLAKKLDQEKYKPSFIIPNDYKEKDVIVTVADYYHEHDKKIIEEDPIEFAKSINKEVNKISDRLENQDGFEETLTETIAEIIIMSRNDEKLDIDKVCDKIIKSTEFEDERVMAYLIKSLGIDMLKWFITSAYDDEYEDYFSKIYKEKYDDLLLDIADLYESTIYEEEADEFSIKDAKDIIDKHSKK